MKKECLLTTLVFGEKYQYFIPLLVYSCNRAYPEYDIMIFVYGQLSKDVRELLTQSKLDDKVTIIENAFSEEKKMNALKASSYRWVLWHEKFLEYNYLYIVDIDMFYIREPKPLHIQHKERMLVSGLPFDNLKRTFYNKRSIKSVLRRIKYAHFHSFVNFISQKTTTETGLSGLHFIDITKYYTEENLKLLEDVRSKISLPYYFPEIMYANDEILLYIIVTDLGYDCSWLGCQSSPTEMLSFDNNLRREFRPHHGIHLGIFKNQSHHEWTADFKKRVELILKSQPYKFYIKEYMKIYQTKAFQDFLALMPFNIKNYILRLNDYYGII